MITQPEHEKGLPGNPEQNKESDDELEQEEEIKEDENLGMDMGIDYEPDKEQDLDDLIHERGTLRKKDEIPPPEEL